MLKFEKKSILKSEALHLSEVIKVLKTKKVNQYEIDIIVSILRYLKSNQATMTKLLKNPIISLYENYFRPLDIIKFMVLKGIKLSSLTMDTYSDFYEYLQFKSMQKDLLDNTMDFVIKSEEEEKTK